MRTPIFPSRREDESFSIEVFLNINCDDPRVLSRRVDEWLASWLQENRHWHWPRQDDPAIDFFDDFVGVPSSRLIGENVIALRFDSRADHGRWWKDWVVIKVMRPLMDHFPELSLEKVVDAEEV